MSPTRAENQCGKLFAIEGIDGAGKTTLARQLAQSLQAKGHRVVILTRYMVPELTRLWQRLIDYDVLDQHMSATVTVCDYSIGLAKHIRPALAKGYLVLADRYYYSHLVYFYLRGIEVNQLEKMFCLVQEPDLVLYISIAAQAALQRLRAKDKPDFWESVLDHRPDMSIGTAFHIYQTQPPPVEVREKRFIDYQEKALAIYPQVLPADRTMTLDSRKPASELVELAMQDIDRLLASPG